MISVDTSIWIDHIHVGEPELDAILLREHALMHPHVLGEIALGSIKNRDRVLLRFERLRMPNVVKEGYVADVIDRHSLWGTGIGYTDAHLLASTFQTPDATLWTRDKRLHAQAERLGVATQW